MINISVSIVLYKTDFNLLFDCLKSLRSAFATASQLFNINFSIDLINNDRNNNGDINLLNLCIIFNTNFFNLTVIDSNFNGGYGYGNNISIKMRSNSDYHLVLNPDVIVDKDSILNAISFMKSNLNVGLLTPQVRGFDGVLHHLCKLNPSLFDMFIRCFPVFSMIFKRRSFFYEMRDKDYSGVIQPVPYPTGCFMFFRTSILMSVNGFDEKYFLHFEDADIGRKINSNSTVAYVPSVLIFHKWSRDTHKSFYMKLITIKSGLRYLIKWKFLRFY